VARLNLQHYWVEESLGYLLHPDIPVPENAKVADIATGTGYVSSTAALHISTTHCSQKQIPTRMS
jgi:ubiquinone/menaquinone biosynthesis C-methylase UbiE